MSKLFSVTFEYICLKLKDLLNDYGFDVIDSGDSPYTRYELEVIKDFRNVGSIIIIDQGKELPFIEVNIEVSDNLTANFSTEFDRKLKSDAIANLFRSLEEDLKTWV